MSIVSAAPIPVLTELVLAGLIGLVFFLVALLAELSLLFLLVAPVGPLCQPVGEYLLLHLVLDDLGLQVGPVLPDVLLLLLGELDLLLGVPPAVVGLECHPVQVQALPRRQVHVELLWLEGLLDGCLPVQFLREYLDEEPNHLPDLVVDEGLPNQSEPDEALVLLVLVAAALFKDGLDCGLLHLLRRHPDHVPVAAGVGLLVAPCEVEKAVGAQVELHQLVQLFDGCSELLPLYGLVVHEGGIALEHPAGDDVVVDSGFGVMPHVEALAHAPDHQDLDVLGQLVVDVLHDAVVVDLPVASLQGVLLGDLQLHGYAIAEGVDFLVGSSCPGPPDPPELVGIGFEDEAVLEQDPVQDVLDGVAVVALVLHALEVLAVVAEEEAQFGLEAALLAALLFLVPVAVLWIHVL